MTLSNILSCLICLRYFLILASLAPIAAFAMSCPNNGLIINNGDSLEQILLNCGNPISKNEYIKNIPLKQEWIYYKNSYNQKNNLKVTVLFDNNQVVNINIVNTSLDNSSCQTMTNCDSANEQNVTGSNVCGQTITSGNGAAQVIYACGKPTIKKDVETYTSPMAELTYDGTSPNTLIIESGKLTGWK